MHFLPHLIYSTTVKTILEIRSHNPHFTEEGAKGQGR